MSFSISKSSFTYLTEYYHPVYRSARIAFYKGVLLDIHGVE